MQFSLIAYDDDNDDNDDHFVMMRSHPSALAVASVVPLVTTLRLKSLHQMNDETSSQLE